MINWNDISNKSITYGLDRGVLYPPTGPGVAWNGLISVDEHTDAYESRSYYMEGQKYLQASLGGDFAASVTAYIYPKLLDEINESGFGLSYRTTHQFNDKIYHKIHILYNAQAVMEEVKYSTLGDSVDTTNFTWEVSTLPGPIDGHKPVAHFVIDTRLAYPWLITALSEELYGTESMEPKLPNFQELLHIFEESSILKITNHGDGTWTAEGPPVYMTGPTEFTIDWDSIVYLNNHTYNVSSL